MVQVVFNVPDVLAAELNLIAVAAGFANAKLMTIAYLRATIRARRGSLAITGLREAAEALADLDTAAID